MDLDICSAVYGGSLGYRQVGHRLMHRIFGMPRPQRETDPLM